MRTLTPMLRTVGGEEFAELRCVVNLRSGKTLALCNVYNDVAGAVADGEVFEAHEVVGMKPITVTINPVHVESVQVLR